jgi:hypothetical protein
MAGLSHKWLKRIFFSTSRVDRQNAEVKNAEGKKGRWTESRKKKSRMGQNVEDKKKRRLGIKH